MKAKSLFKWYTVVVVLVLFLFSVCCWGETVLSNVKYKTKDHYELFSDVRDRIDRLKQTWESSLFQKERLSKADIIISYFTTGQIISTEVLLGDDNWLFYKSNTDGDSIADYEGTNIHTAEELNRILETVLRVQEYFENRGSKFLIVVPPNKENVYSEYMPDIYRQAELSRTDILTEYLANGGVKIISSKKEIVNKVSDCQLYYSYDTHWNQLGAYVAVRQILSEWGINILPLSERSVSASDLREGYHYCADDDLARLVGLRWLFNDEREYHIDGTGDMDWTVFADEQNRAGISCFENKSASIDATLLLVGDSFRSAMIPSLREVFSEVYVLNRATCSPDLIDTIEPNYVIVEYAERYSGRMEDSSWVIVSDLE